MASPHDGGRIRSSPADSRGRRWLGREPEDLLDPVEAGSAAGEPRGGAHGADGEVSAGLGAMDELDALAPADEVDRVFAGVVAPAQGLDADRALGSRSRLAGALEHIESELTAALDREITALFIERQEPTHRCVD